MLLRAGHVGLVPLRLYNIVPVLLVMIHECVSVASAARLSMSGVKGAHPWLVTRLQYGLGFSMVLTVMFTVSFRHPYSEVTMS